MHARTLGIWGAGLVYAWFACASALPQNETLIQTPGQPPAVQLPATQTKTPIAKSILPPAGDRYAAEPAVIESNDREITIASDGTGSEHQTIVVRVQTEAAVKDLSVVSFPFASASQHVDIDYMRVRHPDGSVVETPVADALEMPTEVMRQAPFYSDLKQKQIPIRGLRPGDRLEWSVRVVRTKAEAPGRFWGISALGF